MFSFELKNTDSYLAVKREKFLLFKAAKILKDIFLIFLIISFLLIGFSLFNFTSAYGAAKLLVLFLSFYLVFWEIDLFKELKIKKPKIRADIIDAAFNTDNYNLAEFLNFNAAKIVVDAAAFCGRKRISISSSALFYSALKFSKDVNLICFRLGLDFKKLPADLRII